MIRSPSIRFVLLSFTLSFVASSALAAPLCQSLFLEAEAGTPAFIRFEKVNPSYSDLTPDQYVQTVVNETASLYESQPLVKSPDLEKSLSMWVRAKRNHFLAQLYNRKLVRADDLTFRLQDKLLMYRLLERYLGEAASQIHPKTVGIKEFLSRRNLIDENGQLTANASTVEAALRTEFPEGFIVKPNVGENSDGRGFYFDEARIVSLLSQTNGSDLYRAFEANQSYSHLRDGRTITGERYILQARLKIPKGSAVGSANEFRAHSYDDQVIQGATMSRWKYIADGKAFVDVNAFLQGILNRLPKKLLDRQAWSFDVFQDADGRMMLVEVNTNKGRPGNWSGFLKTQRILGAYVRHFESRFGWHFEGVHGWLLRNNLGNLTQSAKYVSEKYWNKFIQACLVAYAKSDQALKRVLDSEDTESIREAQRNEGSQQ